MFYKCYRVPKSETFSPLQPYGYICLKVEIPGRFLFKKALMLVGCTIGNLHVRLTFNLSKANKIFYNS